MANFRINSLIAIALFIISGCITTLAEGGNTESVNNKISDKKILSLMLDNLDVKLKDAKFCKNMGTDFSDKKLSDYIAGFWSFHSEKHGDNWIEVNSTSISEKVVLAKVMLYRNDNEENWGWGLSFEIYKVNLTVNRKSFTCLGGG